MYHHQSIIIININFIDLRAKVSDNELYTTKLMKEKSQLQERVTSLEEQSIKETSSIGLQFNYIEEEQLKPNDVRKGT